MVLGLHNESKAQDGGADYNTAIGLTVGGIDFRGVGISAKHFFKPSAAGEANLTFYDYAISIDVLYEYHSDIANAAGLKWYVGGGPSLIIPEGGGDVGIGLVPVIGLDYKFNEIPINLAFDWRPFFLLTPDTDFEASSFGLSIRYAF